MVFLGLVRSIHQEVCVDDGFKTCGTGRVFLQLVRTSQSRSTAFRRQLWDEAATKFEQAIENTPNDGPAHFYAKLCEEYRIDSPGNAWDGVIVLEEK